MYLALIVTLLIAGCGTGKQEQAAAAKKANAAKEHKLKAAEFNACKSAFTDLLKSLSQINSDLGVGLNLGDYGSDVRRANRNYNAVMSDGSLGGVDCLEKVGLPAEKAVKLHIKTFNLWGGCVSDISCEDESIEPRRQKLWRQASSATDRAVNHLAAMSPDAGT